MRTLLVLLFGLFGAVVGFHLAGVAARHLVSAGLAHAAAGELLAWTVAVVLGGIGGGLLGGALARQLWRMWK